MAHAKNYNKTVSTFVEVTKIILWPLFSRTQCTLLWLVYQRFVHLRGDVGFKAFLLLVAHVIVVVGHAHSR